MFIKLYGHHSLVVNHETDNSYDSYPVAVHLEDFEFPCCSFCFYSRKYGTHMHTHTYTQKHKHTHNTHTNAHKQTNTHTHCHTYNTQSKAKVKFVHSCCFHSHTYLDTGIPVHRAGTRSLCRQILGLVPQRNADMPHGRQCEHL